MKPSIQERESLADYPQIGLFLYQILHAALRGGMTDAEGEKTYNQIIENYSNLEGEMFRHFRDELIRILVTPDAVFELPDGEEQCFTDWTLN